MRITQFNGYNPKSQSKNLAPAFGIKLVTSENALAFYEKRLGSKLKASEALDKFSKAIEAATPDINMIAKLDIDQKSMEKPELFIQDKSGEILRTSKYPAWVLPNDILPEPHDQKPLQSAVKHAVNCMHRIMGENGQGFDKNNVFSDAFKKVIG